MKGTVGSGKSTHGQKIKELIEERGGTCYVEGTDKYCKKGMTVPEAVIEIKAELSKINELHNPLPLVVIIDTCGESDSKNNMVAFGVEFKGWTKVNLWPNLDRRSLEGYFSWSLRNVLQRTINAEANYHLNPIKAGVSTCLTVHQKKARTLFGKKSYKLPYFSSLDTKESIIEKLNEKANQYQNLLDSTMPLNSNIEKFLQDNLH